MNNSTHAKTLKLVQLALLAALAVVLTLLPIQVGTIVLNFGLVPIVMAGALLGPVSGCIIGAVSGIVTMIQVLSGSNPVYVILLAVNPVVSALLCVVKTAAAGYVSGLVFLLAKKTQKKALRVLFSILSAAVCPVVNTGIFALGMLTVFGGALQANELFASFGGDLVAIVFVGLIGFNFFVELIINVVVDPILMEAFRAAKLIK